MLSLVLPTYNESQNIPRLLATLQRVLAHTPHEIIIVDDDSPDRTWAVAQQYAERHGAVRVIRRVGKRGLSSAVVDGWREAGGDILAAMDADGQHDETILPQLYAAVRAGATVAIGSRYTEGGSVGTWHGIRSIFSAFNTLVTRLGCGSAVRDPLSGYFAVRRSAIERILPHLKPRGFKILLDLLVRLPRSARIVEVPYVFRPRAVGESKLSLSVQWWFMLTLLRGGIARFGMHAFVILCVALAVVLGRDVWRLQLLYSNGDLRARVAAEMRLIADEQGWLISDMLPIRLTPDALQISYHPHRRGIDDPQCYFIHLERHALIPCAQEP